MELANIVNQNKDVVPKPRLDLLGMASLLAAVGYCREADQCATLCKAAYTDTALWDRIIGLTHVQDKTRLHWACRKLDLERVQWLVARGADKAAADGSHYTPLMHAISVGRAGIAIYLCGAGADPNKCDKFSCLEMALLFWPDPQQADVRRQLLRALAAAGADTSSKLAGFSGLSFACSRMELPDVQILVDMGADINAVSNGDCPLLHGTPLAAAAGAGKLDVVAYLLDRGADVNGANSSAVMDALCSFKFEAVVLLLSRGASLPSGLHDNLVKSRARVWDFLHGLTSADRRDTLKDFLAKIVEPATPEHHQNLVDTLLPCLCAAFTSANGFTVLLGALTKRPIATIKVLGCEFKAKDNSEPCCPVLALLAAGHAQEAQKLWTMDSAASIRALVMLCVEGKTEAASTLLSLGSQAIDVTYEGKRGVLCTPLIAAAINGRVDTVDMLLSRGATYDLVVDHRHNRQTTALHAAVDQTQAEVVELLCRHAATRRGVDIVCRTTLDRALSADEQDKGELTPLLAAMRAEHPGMVRALLDVGKADPCRSYNTPDLFVLPAVMWSFWNFSCSRPVIECLLDLIPAHKDLQGHTSDWEMIDLVGCACQYMFRTSPSYNKTRPEPDRTVWLLSRLHGLGVDLSRATSFVYEGPRTLLAAAIYWRHLDAAKWLLNIGVPVDAPSDDDGRTALMLAAGACAGGEDGGQMLDMVHMLLLYGADVEVKDKRDMTALDHIMDKTRGQGPLKANHLEIAKVLQARAESIAARRESRATAARVEALGAELQQVKGMLQQVLAALGGAAGQAQSSVGRS